MHVCGCYRWPVQTLFLFLAGSCPLATHWAQGTHTWGTDSGKGLVQALFVSSEPLGKGILRACPLGPARLLPQAKGTVEKARGTSAQSDPWAEVLPFHIGGWYKMARRQPIYPMSFLPVVACGSLEEAKGVESNIGRRYFYSPLTESLYSDCWFWNLAPYHVNQTGSLCYFSLFQILERPWLLAQRAWMFYSVYITQVLEIPQEHTKGSKIWIRFFIPHGFTKHGIYRVTSRHIRFLI